MNAEHYEDYIENLQKTMKFCTNPEILGIDYNDAGQLTRVVFERFNLDAACFRRVSEKGLFRLVEFDGKLVSIDEDIVDIILRLNECGFKTMCCCQGHKERYFPRDYYISFTPTKQNENLTFSIFEALSGVDLDRKALMSNKVYDISVKPKRSLLKRIKVEKGALGHTTIRVDYNKVEAIQRINDTILEILEGQK